MILTCGRAPERWTQARHEIINYTYPGFNHLPDPLKVQLCGVNVVKHAERNKLKCYFS